MAIATDLPYVEHGYRSGTPVLLLHGLGDSWRSFETVLPHLPESLRVIAVTLRGHGEASRPPSGYRIADFAADITAFMDRLELEAAVLVGHSLGTAIAQRFAIDSPQRALGLVLVGPFICGRPDPELQELWDSTISKLTDPVDPAFIRAFQESTLAQPVPEDFFATIMEESMKVPARVWKEVFRSVLEEDFSDEIGTISVPTLLVWGDRDELCPLSEQEAILARIEGSLMVTYAGAGHGVHWEEPERFASDLAEFVRLLVT